MRTSSVEALRPGGVVVIESIAADADRSRANRVVIDPDQLRTAYGSLTEIAFEQSMSTSDWGLRSLPLVRFAARRDGLPTPATTPCELQRTAGCSFPTTRSRRTGRSSIGRRTPPSPTPRSSATKTPSANGWPSSPTPASQTSQRSPPARQTNVNEPWPCSPLLEATEPYPADRPHFPTRPHVSTDVDDGGSRQLHARTTAAHASLGWSLWRGYIDVRSVVARIAASACAGDVLPAQDDPDSTGGARHCEASETSRLLMTPLR